MSVDWTTVLIATGPAAVTGLLGAGLGWYTAKKNSEVAIATADAPVRQVGLSEAIADRRDREQAYVTLVNSIDWLLNLRGRVGENGLQTARWKLEFDGQVNRVKILGAYDVPAAAAKCAEIVQVMIKRDGGGGGLMFTDAGAFDQNESELAAARDSLIEAMRKDVAPRNDESASQRP